MSHNPSTLALSSTKPKFLLSELHLVTYVTVAGGGRGGLEYLNHPIEQTLNLCCNTFVLKRTDLLKGGTMNSLHAEFFAFAVSSLAKFPCFSNKFRDLWNWFQ